MVAAVGVILAYVYLEEVRFLARRNEPQVDQVW